MSSSSGDEGKSSSSSERYEFVVVGEVSFSRREGRLGQLGNAQALFFLGNALEKEHFRGVMSSMSDELGDGGGGGGGDENVVVVEVEVDEREVELGGVIMSL